MLGCLLYGSVVEASPIRIALPFSITERAIERLTASSARDSASLRKFRAAVARNSPAFTHDYESPISPQSFDQRVEKPGKQFAVLAFLQKCSRHSIEKSSSVRSGDLLDSESCQVRHPRNIAPSSDYRDACRRTSSAKKNGSRVAHSQSERQTAVDSEGGYHDEK